MRASYEAQYLELRAVVLDFLSDYTCGGGEVTEEMLKRMTKAADADFDEVSQRFY